MFSLLGGDTDHILLTQGDELTTLLYCKYQYIIAINNLDYVCTMLCSGKILLDCLNSADDLPLNKMLII